MRIPRGLSPFGRYARTAVAACALSASAGVAVRAQAPADAASSLRRSAAVRVLTVASPAPTERPWHYAVQMAAGARLLGAAEGTVTGARALMFTVQLTDALASGEQLVGVVRFDDGASRVERALRLNVPARRAIDVVAARAARAVQPGEVLYLPFAITNRGNAADTLRLAVNAPSGWQAAVASVGTFVLAPGAQMRAMVRVRPPVTLSAGSGLVVLQAADVASTQAATVQVEVGTSRAAARVGPEMTVGVANLRDSFGTAQQAYSLSLRGQIADGLQVDAALATPLSHDPRSLRAASLLGAPVSSGSRLRLAGARGSAEVGRIGMRLPDLGGLSIGGDGLALRWRAGDGSEIVAAAARQAGPRGAGGPQGAVQWSSRPAPVTVHVGASLLDERESTGRRLEAFTFGARLAPGPSATFGVDVAERRFADGHGLGVGAEVTWDRPATSGRLRLFHAPGGAAAFAMARDGAFFESRWTLGGGWQASGQSWLSRDNAFDGSPARTLGGALTPGRRIGEHADVGFTASLTRYENGTGPARRGDTEQQLMARAGAQVGATRWDVEAGEERSLRTARFAGRMVREYASRAIARSSVTWPSALGALSVRGSYRAASTMLASEASVDVRVSDVHPIPHWRALTLEGSSQRVYLGMAGMSAANAAVSLALPGGARVLAGVQRENLLAATTRGASTMYSLRLERTMAAPGLARLAQRTGIVFLDLDGNGVRDRDEPGLAGVTVRLGGQSTTTDRSGRYRFPVEPGKIVIDVRTLAEGQRPGTPAHADARDLPVHGTARLVVQVRREAGLGHRGQTAATMVVSAVDAAGKEWLVTADESGHARFDALPAGEYVVSARTEGTDAPLRVEPVGVRIPANAMRETTVELVSRARPVRMQGGSTGTKGPGPGMKQ